MIDLLRSTPITDGWVLNDLIHFPERSELRFFGDVPSDEFSFVHRSGHPAAQPIKAIILRGKSALIADLLRNSPPEQPFVIRETPWALAEAVRSLFSEAVLYQETQMVVDEGSAKLTHGGEARVITAADVDHLISFMQWSSNSRNRVLAWIENATIVGVFAKGVLVAMGSTFFALPEVCQLVAITTLPEYRGRGYGSNVTSKLIELALRKSQYVTLAVRSDNHAAVRLYANHGFSRGQERLWASVGYTVLPSPD